MPKIDELPAAGALTGDELLPLVQGGTTVQSTLSDVASFVASVPSITSPLDLPNLIAWYDATQGVYSGASYSTPIADNVAVSKWSDLSGNDNHLYGTANGGAAINRPEWTSGPSTDNSVPLKTQAGNKPALNFIHGVLGDPPGTNNAQVLYSDTNAFALGGDVLSTFVVYADDGQAQFNGNIVSFRDSAETVTYPGDWTTAESVGMLGLPASAICAFRNGELANISKPTVRLYRMGSVFDGANCTVYLNRTTSAVEASTGTFGSLGTLAVGGYYGTYPCPGQCAIFDGRMSELVICKAVLTADQITALDNYFCVKWGL